MFCTRFPGNFLPWIWPTLIEFVATGAHDGLKFLFRLLYCGFLKGSSYFFTFGSKSGLKSWEYLQNAFTSWYRPKPTDSLIAIRRVIRKTWKTKKFIWKSTRAGQEILISTFSLISAYKENFCLYVKANFWPQNFRTSTLRLGESFL